MTKVSIESAYGSFIGTTLSWWEGTLDFIPRVGDKIVFTHGDDESEYTVTLVQHIIPTDSDGETTVRIVVGG
jgi:hypothetical protein